MILRNANDFLRPECCVENFNKTIISIGSAQLQFQKFSNIIDGTEAAVGKLTSG